MSRAVFQTFVKLLKTNILNASKFLLTSEDAFEAKYSILSKHFDDFETL